MDRECKVCKLTLDVSNYGLRRAVCLKCSYAKNKEYLKTYYKENRTTIITRVMEVYNDKQPLEKKPRGRPRKTLKKDLIIEEPANEQQLAYETLEQEQFTYESLTLAEASTKLETQIVAINTFFQDELNIL